MHRFIDGEDRMQPALLPHSLEDYVDENNSVRVIEVFIDELDLAALGFSGMTPAVTGRPAYHPSTLLKIYLYGYLNRIQSSRRLEREAQRNIELMWLTGRLAPDFKTIADFRKDNGLAIRAVCSQFVGLCRRLRLFTHAVVAIDGSKFKAVNNRDQNYTVAKVTGRMEQVNASIAHYLRALDQGRPGRERYRRGQIGPAEGEDCRPAPPDAGPEGDGAEGSGRTRPASLADRSRRPFDGY
jgi:transposase